ncbi:MAG: hypothetical protein WBE34_01835 [Candidatus Nitrosopolaris sp.]
MGAALGSSGIISSTDYLQWIAKLPENATLLGLMPLVKNKNQGVN